MGISGVLVFDQLFESKPPPAKSNSEWSLTTRINSPQTDINVCFLFRVLTDRHGVSVQRPMKQISHSDRFKTLKLETFLNSDS